MTAAPASKQRLGGAAVVLVDRGALHMALNILRRGTPIQREAAAELEKAVRDDEADPEPFEPIDPPNADPSYADREAADWWAGRTR